MYEEEHQKQIPLVLKPGYLIYSVNLSKITITEYFMKRLPENLLANKILFDLKC